MSQRKTGAFLNFVTLGLNSFVGILFTPFLLRSLGQAEYGLYQLIGAFAGYLMLLDFGIQATAIRYIAKYRAKDDPKGEENFLAIILTTYLIISLILISIGASVYTNMDVIFANTLTVEEIAKAKVMFAVLVVSIVALLIEKTFSGAIMGREQFVFAKLTALIQVFIKVSAWVVVLLLGYGSVALVIVTGCVNLLLLLASAFYVLVRLKVRIRFHKWDPSLIREIISYSFLIFLTAIVTQINYKAGNFILGVMVSTSAVAIFALAMQLIQIFCSFGVVVPSIFFPATIHLVTNGESLDQTTSFVVQPSRYTLIVLMPVTIAFGLFGRQFILLWAGAEYEDAWLMAFSLMVVLTIPLAQGMLSNVIKAQGRLVFQCLVYFVAGLFNIVISVICVYWIGMKGVLVGTIAGFVVGHLIIMNWYYHFFIGLDIPRYFRELFKGLWIVFLISSLAGAMNYFPGAPSWFLLVAQCVVFVVVYFIALWFIGVNAVEKNLVNTFVKHLQSFVPLWSANSRRNK